MSARRGCWRHPPGSLSRPADETALWRHEAEAQVDCTLIHEPELAILDEPTTGVDPVSRRTSGPFWQNGSRQGMTALVSTAYMDEAARFHRLSFLSHGQVLASGTPSDVRALVPGLVVTVEVNPATGRGGAPKTSVSPGGIDGPLTAACSRREPDAGLLQDRGRIGLVTGHAAPHRRSRSWKMWSALLLKEQDAQAGASAASGHAAHSWNRQPFDGLAVQAKELIRDFGSFRAVDRVSFDMKQAKSSASLGRTAREKTTVIKMLTGILPPTGGEGRVAGADMRTASGAIKERIGYMSQAFSLYLDLTVIENIRLFAGIYGLARRQAQQRMAWIVDMAGLGDMNMIGRTPPHGGATTSGIGLCTRPQPACPVSGRTDVGVDPIGRRRFWRSCRGWPGKKASPSLSPHTTSVKRSTAIGWPSCMPDDRGRRHAGGTQNTGGTGTGPPSGDYRRQTGAALATRGSVGIPGAALFGTKIHVLA